MLVLLNSYENNLYHDSYFYDVLVDTVAGTVNKHMTHTTAMGGYSKPESTPYKELDDANKALVDSIISDAAKEELEKFDGLVVGDVVKVVRGRKYKIGNEYTVTGFSNYKDRWGRIMTRYADIGDDGRISENNIELLSRTKDEEVLADVVSNLRYWGYYRYSSFSRVS